MKISKSDGSYSSFQMLFCKLKPVNCIIAGKLLKLDSRINLLCDHPELGNSLLLRAKEKFRVKHTWLARAASVLKGLTY